MTDTWLKILKSFSMIKLDQVFFELSNIDHPNITDSCMMKKVGDNYIFEFDIEDW